MAARETGQENAGAIENSRDDRDPPWPRLPHPQATHERRETKHQNRNGERERDFFDGPAECLRQRNTKYAPGIHRTEGDLHDHACGGDSPAIRGVSGAAGIGIRTDGDGHAALLWIELWIAEPTPS